MAPPGGKRRLSSLSKYGDQTPTGDITHENQSIGDKPVPIEKTPNVHQTPVENTTSENGDNTPTREQTPKSPEYRNETIACNPKNENSFPGEDKPREKELPSQLYPVEGEGDNRHERRALGVLLEEGGASSPPQSPLPPARR